MQKFILLVLILFPILLIAQDVDKKEKKRNKKEVEKIVEYGLSDSEMEILKDPIFFNLNSSELDSVSLLLLDKKVELLEQHPELKILLLGHTDNSGKNQISANFGLRRANSAKRYMVERGIADERLATLTYSIPIPEDPVELAKMRHVAFDIDTRKDSVQNKKKDK